MSRHIDAEAEAMTFASDRFNPLNALEKGEKKCEACYDDTDEWYAIPYNYHNEVNEYDSNLILCKECFEILLELLRERK